MDKDCIAKLLEIGGSPEGLAKAQKIAAQALAAAGAAPFPPTAVRQRSARCSSFRA